MDKEAEVMKERIHTEPLLNDPKYITLLSLVVLLFTIFFWWFFSRKRQARNAVVLTGLSDSGKTLLFVQLVYSEYKKTFTSMKENVEEYTTSKGVLKVVDIPGQERLRGRFFDQYKSSAKAIVYVVDSVTVQKDIRDVAEYLYNILSDRIIQSNSTPVLVLCNKQDLPLAKGGQIIRGMIEKELNLVRTTKASQLQSVDPNQGAAATLGKPGKDLELKDLPCKVDVRECSASGTTSEPPHIESLHEWINML